MADRATHLATISGIGKPKRVTKAPKHLRAATRRWFEHISDEYELESHHVMILVIAAEAWDRHLEAREALEENGATFENPKTGDIKPRPEIMIERDSRNAFMRAIRELNLSEQPSEAPRPNPLRYGGKR